MRMLAISTAIAEIAEMPRTVNISARVSRKPRIVVAIQYPTNTPMTGITM